MTSQIESKNEEMLKITNESRTNYETVQRLVGEMSGYQTEALTAQKEASDSEKVYIRILPIVVRINI